jgi:hypothetical protein
MTLSHLLNEAIEHLFALLGVRDPLAQGLAYGDLRAQVGRLARRGKFLCEEEPGRAVGKRKEKNIKE